MEHKYLKSGDWIKERPQCRNVVGAISSNGLGEILVSETNSKFEFVDRTAFTRAISYGSFNYASIDGVIGKGYLERGELSSELLNENNYISPIAKLSTKSNELVLGYNNLANEMAVNIADSQLTLNKSIAFARENPYGSFNTALVGGEIGKGYLDKELMSSDLLKTNSYVSPIAKSASDANELVFGYNKLVDDMAVKVTDSQLTLNSSFAFIRENPYGSFNTASGNRAFGKGCLERGELSSELLIANSYISPIAKLSTESNELILGYNNLANKLAVNIADSQLALNNSIAFANESPYGSFNNVSVNGAIWDGYLNKEVVCTDLLKTNSYISPVAKLSSEANHLTLGYHKLTSDIDVRGTNLHSWDSSIVQLNTGLIERTDLLSSSAYVGMDVVDHFDSVGFADMISDSCKAISSVRSSYGTLPVLEGTSNTVPKLQGYSQVHLSDKVKNNCSGLSMFSSDQQEFKDHEKSICELIAGLSKEPNHIGFQYSRSSSRPDIKIYFIFTGDVNGNNMHIGDNIININS